MRSELLLTLLVCAPCRTTSGSTTAWYVYLAHVIRLVSCTHGIQVCCGCEDVPLLDSHSKMWDVIFSYRYSGSPSPSSTTRGNSSRASSSPSPAVRYACLPDSMTGVGQRPSTLDICEYLLFVGGLWATTYLAST